MTGSVDWPKYLSEFHGQRPGITEALLSRSVGAGGGDPYTWASETLPATTDSGATGRPVLDIACGNGPMAPRASSWVGLDLSMAELEGAHSLVRSPVAAATSAALPIASDSVATVLAIMSLMVVDDPAATLGEARRVLGSGGKIIILLPAERPVSPDDIGRYAMLFAALGRLGLPFPHRDLGRKLKGLLGSAGFELISDQRQRFEYPIRDVADADLLLASLYVPGVSERRMNLGRRAVRSWIGSTVGLPLRRVVAQSHPRG